MLVSALNWISRLLFVVAVFWHCKSCMYCSWMLCKFLVLNLQTLIKFAAQFYGFSYTALVRDDHFFGRNIISFVLSRIVLEHNSVSPPCAVTFPGMLRYCFPSISFSCFIALDQIVSFSCFAFILLFTVAFTVSFLSLSLPLLICLSFYFYSSISLFLSLILYLHFL